MRKKTAVLFVILATLFNILVTLLCLALLILLVFLGIIPRLPPQAARGASSWALPAVFAGALILSFIIHRLVLKRFIKRLQRGENAGDAA
ncbi:MAG: leader peptide processing enzyme [Spirochaetaceae bacterium]|jgi:hypothetical protein|nr:leader peptide processing enzyme [Spirochaetaceae bacterium]